MVKRENIHLQIVFFTFLPKKDFVSNPHQSFCIYTHITPDYGTRIIIRMPA